MAKTLIQPVVSPMEKIEITYREKSALFGMLRWWALEKERSFGKYLVINTDEAVDEIILNGKKINLKE